MHLVKRDSLPLGLAHDGCVCFHLGFMSFGSTKRGSHGGDLHTMRYACVEFINLYIGFVQILLNHTSHFSWACVFAGAKGEIGAAWLQSLLAPSVAFMAMVIL